MLTQKWAEDGKMPFSAFVVFVGLRKVTGKLRTRVRFGQNLFTTH